MFRNSLAIIAAGVPAVPAALAAFALVSSPPVQCALAAEDSAAPKVFGWRGNLTGLFPEADPPTQWGRIARGVVAGMTAQATKPGGGSPGNASSGNASSGNASSGDESSGNESSNSGRPVRDGLIRQWLVIGPFPVADSVNDFGREQIAGEAQLMPAEGDKVGQLAWQRLELTKKPDYDRWGTTELDWVDLGEPLGYQPNQVAYAHSYLHCRRPGKVAMVVDHGHGLKVWVNGEPVYANPERNMALGSYVGISRQKKDLVNYRSPRFEIDLKPGWNRLLVKVGAYNRQGWRSMKFAPRLMDVEPAAYEEKNVVWMTELPERTNAVPIIVGDRVFTVAEPDELLCLEKGTGKILWRRFNGLYDAIPETQRNANPVFRQKIEPLAERLQETTDHEQSIELRRQIRDLLVEVDKKKYRMKWDGHLASHFGIVGFTTTPTSDGKHVYVFFGHGVAACYDLRGNRQWIRRLEADEIRYSCSPALIGGKLLVIFGGMHALDAETGAIVWQKPEVTSIASLIPARIRGTDVVSNRSGQLFRVSDGKLLWANPHIRQGDTGWAAPVILDDVMYLPWTGIGSLIVADFSKVTGKAWEPKLRVIEVASDHRRPSGEWLDRWTAGSPLIYQGTYYGIDQYGVFYAVDLATGQTLYKQDVGFDELHHYNAIGVAAGATLGGKHIYVLDNQGTCVVLEPGPVFKQVAVNRIETVVQRDWPIPPQEILANGAPVFDGKSMYLRGERHLYCIGEKR